MSRPINQTSTLTTHPTSIDNTNSVYPGTFYNNNNLENSFTDASSSTRAAFYTTTGSRAVTKVYLNFDECANIPSGATINSVSCSVKCGTQGTNYFGTRTVQMCTGTTTKGSATTMSGSNSSPSTHTLRVGTWTASELQNAKLYFYMVRGTSNTTTEATFSVFGATLTVNYTISDTAYTIGATSNVTGTTVDPSTQEILGGEDATVSIYTSSIDDITVTDNDVDVTNQLVRKKVNTGGTIERAPASYTTSGSISGTRYTSAVGHTVENPSTQTGNDYCNSSGSTATIYYHFNFTDIPEEATINSMNVQVIGHLESTSQAREVAELNTYYGTTAKGTQTEFTTTTNQTITISPGTWTTAELREDARVGFTIGYYGGLVTGITWSVTYSVPSSGDLYYYEYTLSNVSADHVIIVDTAGPYIPPEEDPEYTYYPITISSINATTNPGSGTTRVQEGTSQVIAISPTDPQLTLALDNGVDITSQLVGGVPVNNYTITTQVNNADYGFYLNSSTGYYVSSNDGKAKSASVARINMDFESDCFVTITYINYAEEDYDYGMFGKLDTAVATDGLTAASGGSSPSDSTSKYQIAKCSNSSSAQTVTYEVPAGEHFIDVKYGKDDASDSGNDSLQWKITSVEATSASGDYTYTLNNVDQKHSLVFIFGNVNYYFINSSGNDCKLYPDGQTVKLEGDSYQLRIVPNEANATVTLKDNNVDRTSTLEYESATDKYGNTVANYIYKLTNITAQHTLEVTCATGAKIYLKVNGAWTQCSKVYKKINGSWVEQNSSTWNSLFDARINYRKMN